jgi:hypothetical protein
MPLSNAARGQAMVQAVRAALVHTGRVLLWRNSNLGPVVPWAKRLDPDARPIDAGLGAGSADLVGMLRKNGRFAAFEVKSGAGVASPEQRLWLAAVRDAGGFAAIVRSPEDALAALERAENGERE